MCMRSQGIVLGQSHSDVVGQLFSQATLLIQSLQLKQFLLWVVVDVPLFKP